MVTLRDSDIKDPPPPFHSYAATQQYAGFPPVNRENTAENNGPPPAKPQKPGKDSASAAWDARDFQPHEIKTAISHLRELREIFNECV